MEYKIIADSSADLLTLDGAEFDSVPLRICTSETEYVDDASLDVEAMISYLSKYKGTSKTSCPNVGDWKDAFDDAEQVFCVTITSNLSGSYNSACLAVEDYLSEKEGRKGFVIDTLSVGPEAVLIIEKLRELISEHLHFDDIKEKIMEYKKKTHLIFSLESLRNLANNGRCSHAVAKISGILGIRIVGKASDVGTLEITDKARGEDRALVDIVKNMLVNGYNGGKVRIHHCMNKLAAEKLSVMIKEKFQKATVFIQETRGLCSFYAESGGLLVGYEGANK